LSIQSKRRDQIDRREDAMDQPIACTLSAREYRGRTDELAALAVRALRSREPTAGGERLTFADGPEIEAELRVAIAAEASCCAFLHMELRRRGEDLILEIAGPQEARPVIAELFA
jgi:hypothetical protein